MAIATPFQKQQALHILETGKIEEIVVGILYRVPSTRPNHDGYFVYYGTPRACNCDHYYFQNKKGVKIPVCSHIKAVGFYRGNQQ